VIFTTETNNSIRLPENFNIKSGNKHANFDDVTTMVESVVFNRDALIV